MADCNNLFLEFNQIIKLSDTKKGILKQSRDALRDRIKNYFKKNKENEIQPQFFGQGSYKMHTIINPIPDYEKDDKGNDVKLEKYDLDDGIYFKVDKDNSQKNDPQTYHNWIKDAVDNHAKSVEDKATCVRVIYADGHHIDLPIYFQIDDKCPQLAHKTKGWIDSDPKEFYEWFNSKIKEDDQLRRIVRYFKAWCDRMNHGSTVEMPSGIIMTILAAEEFSPNSRDDISFRDTMNKIFKRLNASFVCYRPTTPTDEDLLGDYNYVRKKHFLDNLESFINSANQATEHPNQKDACFKWQKHFGERFSCSIAKDEIEESNKYSKPAIISSAAKSG